MDKEDVVCVYNIIKYYSAIKKNEITPFAATRMDREIIILSEVRQRNIIWYHLYADLKNKKDTNELIYKTETDPQTYKTKLMVTKGEMG